MRFPTPRIKAIEKRKASIDSVAVDDDGPALGRKLTRRDKKAKHMKAEVVKEKGERALSPPNMIEDQPIERTASPLTPTSTTSSQKTPPITTRKDSQQSSRPSHIPTDMDPPTMDSTSSEAQQPRRSSRIRNSMHNVANTWTKARPYLERLNGTIMPLQPQGTTAYYARDGVKAD